MTSHEHGASAHGGHGSHGSHAPHGGHASHGGQAAHDDHAAQSDHGAHDNGLFEVGDEVPLLAETLAQQGYRTAAFVSAFVLSRRFGLDQGFEHYDDAMTSDGGREMGALERPAPQTVQAALQWLEQAPPEPWFLWLHFYDPHFPYDPPADCLTRAGGDRYLGEVLAVDDEIGRLLRALEEDGRLERTCVVVATSLAIDRLSKAALEGTVLE